MVREIPISGKCGFGMVVLIDDEDYERVSRYRWQGQTSRDTNLIYAFRTIRECGKKRCLRMHRWLIGATPGSLVDHKNGNTLDNRKCNLRETDAVGNATNSRPRKDSITGYKGVTIRRGRWIAGVYGNGEDLTVGPFATAKDAARAYDVLATERYGAFARLNFPDDELVDLTIVRRGRYWARGFGYSFAGQVKSMTVEPDVAGGSESLDEIR